MKPMLGATILTAFAKRALVVTIELLDGAGKTEQVRIIKETLEHLGVTVVVPEVPDAQTAIQRGVLGFLADLMTLLPLILASLSGKPAVVLLDGYYAALLKEAPDPETARKMMNLHTDTCMVPDVAVDLRVPYVDRAVRLAGNRDFIPAYLSQQDEWGTWFPGVTLSIDGARPAEEVAAAVLAGLNDALDQACGVGGRSYDEWLEVIRLARRKVTEGAVPHDPGQARRAPTMRIPEGPTVSPDSIQPQLALFVSTP